MDPLHILDLSVIKNQDIIPEYLTLKYHKDLQKANQRIDLTTTATME